AEAVVKHRSRPLEEGQPHSLPTPHHVLRADLGQLRGLTFLATEGSERYANGEQALASHRVADRLGLFDPRHGRGEVAFEEMHQCALAEGHRKHAESAVISGASNVADGKQVPVLVVPQYF